MSAVPSSPLLTHHMGDVSVVEFLDTSVLDQLAIERIQHALEDLVAKSGLPKLVISFENVKHISSAMLGVLVSLNKSVAAKGGQIRLAGLNKNIADVFKMTKLDKVMKLYDSSEKALVKF
jgi:anti-sigma B factor antagonist